MTAKRTITKPTLVGFQDSRGPQHDGYNGTPRGRRDYRAGDAIFRQRRQRFDEAFAGFPCPAHTARSACSSDPYTAARHPQLHRPRSRPCTCDPPADKCGRERPVGGIYSIDGMAGVGKTAFAVHVAHRLAPNFPDGQLFVRLHAHTAGQPPTDPSHVLGTLLINDGIAAQHIPDDLDARINLWRTRMADKNVLVVLRRCRRARAGPPLASTSAGSIVLITSRRRLAALDDATLISLDTLPSEDSAKLFVRLASRPHLQHTDETVGDMVRAMRLSPPSDPPSSWPRCRSPILDPK